MNFITEGLMQKNKPISKQDYPEPAFYMLSYFRGDIFYNNLKKLINAKQAMRNLEILSQRNNELNIETLSYRTLHHWDSLGLIECQRGAGSGWRKFNVAETLWVHVIIELRNMGVSLNSISKVKPIFFEEIPSHNLKYLDYYLVAALYFKTPVFFVISSTEDYEFLSYEEMSAAMMSGCLNHCTLIHLNPLMDKIFKKIKIVSEFPLKRTLTDEQNKICNFIDQEDFDSIKISKVDDKISNIEIERGFSKDVPYKKIREHQTNALITTRVANGVDVSTKLVKRIKL